MPEHNILARVWILLQARVDIVSITREILGQLLLDSRSSVSSAASFDFFVGMKVIYDLQRTYSQSFNPSSTSKCYMLPQEMLFDTIDYVVHIRPGQQTSQDSLGDTDLVRRYFASRVLLSGLRALQLRQRETDSQIQAQRLQEIDGLVQSWSHEAKEYPAEHFILTKCQRAISHIKRGPGTHSVWHLPAAGACKLRDIHDGLVLFLLSPSVDVLRMLNTVNSTTRPLTMELYQLLLPSLNYYEPTMSPISGHYMIFFGLQKLDIYNGKRID
ncbi:hypothetical protein ACEPPN_004731 [Leptodophora sp. 'Broadleaf-Isolate-01']